MSLPGSRFHVMLNGIFVGFTVCVKHLDNKIQKATSDILEDEEGCVCMCVCVCLFLFIFIGFLKKQIETDCSTLCMKKV